MPHFRSAISHLRCWALPLCLLGFLWFTLLNHVRVEWTVNPQYGYGWAVPFLCAFLIWKRAKGQKTDFRRQKADVRKQRAEGRGHGEDHETTGQQDYETSGQFTVVSGQKSDPVTEHASSITHAASAGFHLPSSISQLLFVCLALAWLPTRLIQEANPEWRLVSWALAPEVVGLTLLIWEMRVGSWKLGGKSVVSGQWSVVRPHSSARRRTTG